MISSWICWVPSNRSRILASRAHFSISSPSPKPVAPHRATQRSATSVPIRPALALAIDAWSELGFMLSAIQAACNVSSRAASQSASMAMNSAAAGGRQRGRRLVVDLNARLGQVVTGGLQAGPGDADGHPGHQRPRVVERLHDPGEAALGGDLRRAEQVLPRHAAVGQDKVGRVRRADAELVLQALELETRVVALHDERLDRRPSL